MCVVTRQGPEAGEASEAVTSGQNLREQQNSAIKMNNITTF